MVAMLPATLRVGRRELQYAVSDNPSASQWAVSIHGYLAGGRPYWREGAILAEQMGWRVVIPSLAGFGGSTPLPWGATSLETLAEDVALLMAHLGAGPAVVLGHSMGGAVAVRYAADRPRETAGLIYRSGVATPAWKQRTGPLPWMLAPFAPALAPFVDVAAAAVLDLPDLMVGRVVRTMRAIAPDALDTAQTMGVTMPIGAMLLTVDLRTEVAAIAAAGVPVLAEWGCFDRIVGPSTAAEFAHAAGTDVLWIPGGHSWMLARPRAQANVLEHLDRGRHFVSELRARQAIAV